jgi:hypothetical protein
VSGSEPGHELSFVGGEFCSIGNCVEAARMPDGRVALRSTLDTEAPHFVVTDREWAQFLDSVKSGHFDLV